MQERDFIFTEERSTFICKWEGLARGICMIGIPDTNNWTRLLVEPRDGINFIIIIIK